MDSDLLRLVSNSTNYHQGNKKRPFRLISSSQQEEGQSDPSMNSVLSGQNPSTSVQSSSAQLLKKRKLNREVKGGNLSNLGNQAIKEIFLSNRQIPNEQVYPFGRMVTDLRNSNWNCSLSKEQIGVFSVKYSSVDQNMINYDLDQEVNDSYQKTNMQLTQRVDARQKSWKNEVNSDGINQETALLSQYQISPYKFSKNVEKESLIKTQDKTVRRSSSSVKSKEKESSSIINEQSHRQESSHNELNQSILNQKALTRKDGKNENEELICLGGQKDLLLNQCIDEMSEIANQGGQEALADLSYMDDDQDEPNNWEVNLLDQFNHLIENERLNKEPIQNTQHRKSTQSIRATNAHITYCQHTSLNLTNIKMTLSPRNERVGLKSNHYLLGTQKDSVFLEEHDNTFAPPVYQQPSNQEDSMICDGEGFSQFTQYQASDLLNEGFIADQYSMVTEPLAPNYSKIIFPSPRGQHELMEAQSDSPIVSQSVQLTRAFPHLSSSRQDAPTNLEEGKKEVENLLLNQSI